MRKEKIIINENENDVIISEIITYVFSNDFSMLALIFIQSNLSVEFILKFMTGISVEYIIRIYII